MDMDTEILALGDAFVAADEVEKALRKMEDALSRVRGPRGLTPTQRRAFRAEARAISVDTKARIRALLWAAPAVS
jgi:hypothetical protein